MVSFTSYSLTTLTNNTESLLNYIESHYQSCKNLFPEEVYSFASEAAWSTDRWHTLRKFVDLAPQAAQKHDFDVGVGKALLAMRIQDQNEFTNVITMMREVVSRGLTTSSTASLQACHDSVLKLHIIYELEAISGLCESRKLRKDALVEVLDSRLEALGAFTSNKQYLLGIRRAAMHVSK